MLSKYLRPLANITTNCLTQVKFPVSLPALAVLMCFVPINSVLAGQPGVCLDEFNGKSQNCTANEGSISAINVIGTSDGCTGTTDTFTSQLTVDLAGANTNRYDSGIYLNTVGGSAKTDTGAKACYQELLIPISATDPTPGNVAGFGPFLDLDNDISDICGDINASTTAVRAMGGSTPGSYDDLVVTCNDSVDALADPNPDGLLDLSGCTSYKHNTSFACDSFDQAGIVGTSSKCGCGEKNVTPSTPIPRLTLSCSCAASDPVYPGFPVSCTATITNANLVNPATGIDPASSVEQPGAGSYFQFQLSDGELAKGTFSDLTPSDGTASLPATDEVLWTPAGGTGVDAPVLGVIGYGEDHTLGFMYENSTVGTYPIRVEGQWSSTADGTYVPQSSLVDLNCEVDVSTTYASVEKVSLQEESGQPVLSWETSTEIGSYAYDVYRLDPISGDYVKANQELLPAAQSGGGGFYRFVDSDALADSRMTYKIFEHATSLSHWHGPYELKMQSSKQSLPQSLEARSKASQMRVDQRNFQARSRVDSSDRSYSRLISKKAGSTKQASNNTAKVTKDRKSPVVVAGAGDQIRIEISKDGFYSLTAEEIAAKLGTSVKKVKWAIKKGNYKLSNRGESVSWEAVDTVAGLRFHGVVNSSIYSDSEVYWLSPGTGRNMAVANGSAPVPAPADLTFASTAHFEEDIEPRYYVAEGPLDDYWYWLATWAGSTSELTGLETPAVAASGDAKLTVELYSFTDEATVNLWLNGTLLEPVSVTSKGKHREQPVTIDAGLLQSLLLPSNTLKVQGLSGVTNIDSFSISYGRHYTAGGNQLYFVGDGNPVVTVTGFDNDDIRVYDLFDSLNPVQVQGVSVDYDGSYQVSLEPTSADAHYLAVALGGEHNADQVTAYTSAGLRNSNHAYDYLVIGPADFADAAQTLIDHRNAGGYRAKFIDVQNIMDEFNHGNLDPEAIRSFLAYAHDNWAVGPELVTIAGAGTLDYKGNLSSDNIVPPLMVMTLYGGLTSSENRFGDLTGNSLPEIFVSRIPAVTASDLSAYIAKLIDYENSLYGSWQDNVVFVADNAEAVAGDFPANSAYLAGLLPEGMTKNELYVGNGPGPHVPPFYSKDTVHDLLKDAFNEGASVINYVGHGAISQLANENLFDSNDVLDLSNQGKLPLVTAMTCNIGFYSLPGFSSLAEAFVLVPETGAIGVWGPTLLSANSQAVTLGEQLLPEIVLTNGGTFGVIARQALQDFLDAGGSAELIYVYDFLGDAALQLK